MLEDFGWNLKERSALRITFCLFLVSLFLRSLALWLLPETHLSDNAITAYLGAADLIRNGEGFLDTSYPVFAPPLYAVIIAFIQTMFGNDQILIKIAQIIADSATSVTIFFIMREILNARVGLLSGSIYTIYPYAIYASTYIGSEAFFTFFLSVFVWFFTLSIKYQKLPFWVFAGFALGVTTMTRGTTQFLPLFMGLLLLRSKEGRLLRDLGNYLLFCFCFALVISPWTIRNYVVLHEFVPVATGASVFLQGSAERFLTIEGKKKEWPQWFDQIKTKGIIRPHPGASPVQWDRFQWRAGFESYRYQIENDPWSLVRFLGTKFARLWYATESGKNHTLIFASNVGIYLLAVLGLLILQVRKDPLTWILTFVVGYIVLLHWVSLPSFRYMVPAMPYIIGWAAVATLTIIDLSRGKKHLTSPRKTTAL